MLQCFGEFVGKYNSAYLSNVAQLAPTKCSIVAHYIPQQILT